MSENRESMGIRDYIRFVILLVTLLGLTYGFYMLGNGTQSKNQGIMEFYKSYLKDSNEYGVKDPERIMKTYFAKKYQKMIDIEGVKRDFQMMDAAKMKFNGEIEDIKIKNGYYNVYVKEWVEVKGKKYGSRKGLYIIGKENGAWKIYFIGVLGSDK